jgi:hypothetical protein
MYSTAEFQLKFQLMVSIKIITGGHHIAEKTYVILRFLAEFLLLPISPWRARRANIAEIA